RFRHLADLCEHGAFPVRFVRPWAAARGRPQLLDALLHRDSFLVRESLELLVDHGGALGGLLRVLRWAHRNLLISLAPGPSIARGGNTRRLPALPSAPLT